MPGISDDAKRNREDWTQANAAYTDARASSNWAEDEMTWGVFGVPESCSAASEMSTASTSSSSAAARRTSRPGSRGVAPAPSAST